MHPRFGPASQLVMRHTAASGWSENTLLKALAYCLKRSPVSLSVTLNHIYPRRIEAWRSVLAGF